MDKDTLYTIGGFATAVAFDLENNLKTLNLSIEGALAYGVDESKMMKNINDVDEFMTS